MADAEVQKTLTRPQVFLMRMFVFLTLVAFLCAILYAQIWRAFLANPALNGLILGVLLVGIAYTFRQILRLYPEIRWVNKFRVSDPGLKVQKPPVLLAPMATMMRDRQGLLSLSTSSMRSILDSIGARLDESRETTRYLVGLLIFLGLLGTFWGLLETISSVGATIGALDASGNDSLVIFEELKAGLEAPLSGMGTAFSSSLFGLAGSLVLGFLDLQAGQAQNRFYNELEDWLSAITDLSLAEMAGQDVAPQLRFAMRDVHRSIAELGARIDGSAAGGGSNDAVRDLAQGIENLVDTLRSEQNVLREWVDEQASQTQELATVLKDLSQRNGESDLTQKKG